MLLIFAEENVARIRGIGGSSRSWWAFPTGRET
jgi:hypothetical protein